MGKKIFVALDVEVVGRCQIEVQWSTFDQVTADIIARSAQQR